MLSSYAGVVRSAQDKLDEYEAGEQDVINEFYKRITVSSRETNHKTLDELRGEDDGKRSIRELPSGSE